ncbi:MAG: DUF4458 domain-containing protein [Bacteroidales bacterium]|nr:DUF4458 domain-containing protein [Bacteroidales bacterium]
MQISRIFRHILLAIVAAASCLALFSCQKEDEPKADGGYGYVQFRLYKEASQPGTKGLVSQLEYLSQAHKIQVSMIYENQTLSQTLVIQETASSDVEFGLRSEKLKLFAGHYEIINFTLYDAVDEPIYVSVPDVAEFDVEKDAMTIHDLFAKVIGRGKVHFTFSKDLSGFENIPETKAPMRQYTFDEIRYIDLTVANTITNERVSFNNLKTKFVIDFDGSNTGYQTSTLTTSEDLDLKAGEWKVISYNTYSVDKILLEKNSNPVKSTFKVEDNKVTDAKVPVTLYEADEYIKDYYALYEIWKSLGGPQWYYNGNDFTRGSNWDFNKDPDLWGDQPGVEIYSNGRVAMINLEGFNFTGYLPAAIGQLVELNQLYLGNHNDPSFLPTNPDDPTLSRATLFERHKARMESLHMPTPMSEPIARALKENGITIPATAMYDYMTEDQLIEKSTGNTIPQIRLMDNVHGVYSNTLKGIDPAIGKLKNLQYLFIANSTIESLPDEFSGLTALTDFEIYNCPKMTKFPMVICDLPEIVSLNISNNAQWSPAEILKGIKGLANGASAGKIQILYMSQNNLEELPEDVKNFKAMGLFDAMSNKLKKVAPFGHDINLVDCYLDNNQITEIGVDETCFFCGIEDIETFSASYNKMTEFPDIFSAKSMYTMGTIDFSYNLITKVQNAGSGYKGIKVSTLTLANNPLTEFPTAFAESESSVSFYNLRGCFIDTVTKEAFDSKNSVVTTSLDLSYNHISKLPSDTFNSVYMPYIYGIDLGNNRFTEFPYETLDSAYLTVLSLRSQRDENGNRCLREWPQGIYQHKGLRGLYLGSNDLRKIQDTISPLIYYLDISDNPNITFDASDICYEWRVGAYILIYDKTQNIINCDYML